MSETDKLKVEMYDEVIKEKNKEYIELTCRFRETCNDIKKKDKEIERLNNIINELEKYLKEQKEIWVNDVFDEVFNKLQELKGSSNNEK